MALVNMKYARDGAQKYPIIFDPVNGDQSTLSQHKLALRKTDGIFMFGEEVLLELYKPIWGENHDKIFNDLLPLIPPMPSEVISKSNWHNYPMERPTEDVMYKTRFRKTPFVWAYNQDSSLMWEQAGVWTAFGVEQWKKVGDPDSYTMSNPDFQRLNEERNAKLLEYKQVLFNTFTFFAGASFPRLYTNTFPVDRVAQLIADTNLQINIWNELYGKKPDGTTKWTEANRWKSEDDIRALEAKNYHLLYRWFIWDEIQNKYVETPIVEGIYMGGTKLKEWLPAKNITYFGWDVIIQSPILMIPPKYTVDQKLRKLIGL